MIWYLFSYFFIFNCIFYFNNLIDTRNGKDDINSHGSQEYHNNDHGSNAIIIRARILLTNFSGTPLIQIKRINREQNWNNCKMYPEIRAWALPSPTRAVEIPPKKMEKWIQDKNVRSLAKNTLGSILTGMAIFFSAAFFWGWGFDDIPAPCRV